MIRRTRPHVVVLFNRLLFDSFFTPKLQDQLSDLFLWTRLPSSCVTPATRLGLASAEALLERFFGGQPVENRVSSGMLDHMT